MCSEFALPQKRTVASRLTRQILCYLEMHPFLLSYFQELWNRNFKLQWTYIDKWQVCVKNCVIIWKMSKCQSNYYNYKWILLRSFITKEKIREQMNRVWLFKMYNSNQFNQQISVISSKLWSEYSCFIESYMYVLLR